MKVPFFSKSKKAQSDLHLSSESSGSSNVESSGSLSFPGASGKKHRKSSSFSGPLDMLRKSSSFSMASRLNSGKLFSLKPFRQRSGPLPKELKPVEVHSEELKSVEVHSKELMETFKYFDKNGDGRISATELGQVLRSVGIASTHEELDVMIREVDGDNDGFIDLAEFIRLNKVTQDAIDDEQKTMAAAFEVFDIDKDGFISAAELHRVLSDLGEVLTEEDCLTMICNVDRNGDQRVDFSEFKYLMQDTRVY